MLWHSRQLKVIDLTITCKGANTKSYEYVQIKCILRLNISLLLRKCKSFTSGSCGRTILGVRKVSICTYEYVVRIHKYSPYNLISAFPPHGPRLQGAEKSPLRFQVVCCRFFAAYPEYLRAIAPVLEKDSKTSKVLAVRP